MKLADDLERRFCFEVVTPMRSCMLQADSEAQRKKWCHYLEAGIAKALRVTNSNRVITRERERQTETETERQRERQRDRERERQRDCVYYIFLMKNVFVISF